MPVRPNRIRRLALLTLTALVPALALALAVTVATSGPAAAHGAPMAPGSRTFLCWQDGLTSNGEIRPQNPACAAAASSGGLTAFYNWFGVLRADGAGRTRGFIPDGALCSGGNPTFSGFDAVRADWPQTHLTSGRSFSFSYNAWAAHPGTFHLYVTKDGYDPSRSLRWDDLEASPFLSVTDPPRSGSVGTVEGKYSWTGTVPAGKSGQHVVYTVWSRSDSTETFYSCSDVVFDGGNGQVTGMGSSGTTPGTSPGTTPTGTVPTGTTPTGTVPTGGVPACTAAYRTTGSWRDGYQGEIVVTNTGTVPLKSWMVHFALPAGQSVGSAWNATVAPDGQSYTASALGWNERLAAKASTAFGFTASGGAAPAAPPSLHCMPS